MLGSRGTPLASRSISSRTRSAPSCSATTSTSREGDTVKTTGRILEVPVGPELLGRVVDCARATRSTARARSTAKLTAPIERVAPGRDRSASRVSQPVQTGYKAIDAMVPIGRGQRELIIGDRQTGKTAIGDRHDHQPEELRH